MLTCLVIYPHGEPLPSAPSQVLNLQRDSHLNGGEHTQRSGLRFNNLQQLAVSKGHSSPFASNLQSPPEGEAKKNTDTSTYLLVLIFFYNKKQ